MSTLYYISEALKHLRAGKLSTKSGGDRGMVFDSFDADVERTRKGVVSVDLLRFNAAVALLEVAEAESRSYPDDLLTVARDLIAHLAEMAPSMRQSSTGTFQQREPRALRDRLSAALTISKGGQK